MSNRTRKIAGGVLLLVVIAAAAVVVASAGNDSKNGQAREIDGAFITGMVPHHRSAVEMAEMALEKAEHPEIKRLAGDIVSAQNKEIEQLTAAHQRIFGEPLPPNAEQHGDLGLSEEEMGMHGDTTMLKDAKPFDPTFIDMMIPHHQGAIRMARVELKKGDDAEMKQLAQAIIDAQSREIKQMNAWRMKWYGAESPAGGVPSDDDAAGGSDGSMGGMEH